MKTIKIPDQLWDSFIIFLNIGYVAMRNQDSDYRYCEKFTPTEIKVLDRIGKLLKKEGML